MSELNPAVILGLYFTGYGIIRELSEYGIPLHAFDYDKKWPEGVTRLAKVHFVRDEADFLRQLITFADNAAKKPVLYLAADSMVDFYNRNRKELQQRFLFNFPDAKVVDLLLEKGAFSDFAQKYKYTIPVTFKITSLAAYKKCAKDIPYPCVLKPYWRRERWLQEKCKKVYFFHNRKELEEILPYLLSIESNLIVQEFIPGTERDLYFHLMCYDADSKCINEFSGRKLRIWPLGFGNTVCAEPAPWAKHIALESKKMFDQLGYKGYGSLEYLLHPEKGIYYIMEPTVGRHDQQSLIAPINGVRMSLSSYMALTGITFPEKQKPAKPYFYIDDQYDAFSIGLSLVKGKLNVKDCVRSLAGRKKYRLLNARDLGVYVHCWTITLIYKIIGKCSKLLKKMR